MNNFDYKTTATAFALVIPICLGLWVLAVPASISLATFTAVMVVMVGGTIVALNTWNNGRATHSIAHVINATEGTTRRE